MLRLELFDQELLQAQIKVLTSQGRITIGGLDAGDVDLEAGAEGVDLVDSLQWDSIDLVRAGDGEEARLELLEADDSLSSESSCEEDEDGSWGDRRSQFPC